MPTGPHAIGYGCRAARLSVLVAFVCAVSGCSPLLVTSRCMVTEPTLAGTDGEAADGAPCPTAMCGSPQGVCSCGACPPVCKPSWHLPRFPRMLHPHRLLWCFGPLFHWGESAQDAAMAEAELQPPHSRFHPVPTAPVFAPRPEYVPAEPMMQMVAEPQLPHRGPHLKSVPTRSLVPSAAPVPAEPGPLFMPDARIPAEAIPPGPADLHLDSGNSDIRHFESEGRRPGGVRLSRS